MQPTRTATAPTIIGTAGELMPPVKMLFRRSNPVRALTVAIAVSALACSEHVTSLHAIALNARYLAAHDTIVTVRGVLASYGSHIPFTNSSVRMLIDGADTMPVVVFDTTTIGRPITLRVKVRDDAPLGFHFGPVLVVTDSTSPARTSRPLPPRSSAPSSPSTLSSYKETNMFNPLHRLHQPKRVNITKIRAEIRETIYKPKKVDLLEAAEEQITAEETRNHQEMAKLDEESGSLEGHPGHEPGANLESKGNVSLATTFAAAGFLTQFMVNQGPFGDYGQVVVAGSSLAIDVGITALGYSVLKSLNNTARPEQTLRVGKLISLGATGVVLLAGAVSMYLRFATENTSDAFFSAASVAMWILAELLPFAAGLWLALARLRAHPHLVAAEQNELRERQAEIDRFRLFLKGEMAKVAPPQTSVGPVMDVTENDTRLDVNDDDNDVGGVGAGRKIPTKVAGLLLVAALAAGTGASAQTCGVASERSLIGLTTARREAIDITLARFDEFINTHGCRVIVASTYTDAGAFSPRWSFQVPKRPTARDCSKPQPITIDRHHGAVGKVPAYREHLQKLAQQQCVVDAARDDSVFNGSWMTFMKSIRTVVAQDQVTLPVRVDISGQIKSFIDVGIRDLIVISPTIDSSNGIPDKISGIRVVFIAYEAKEAFGGKAATDASSERWRKAGAIVVAYPQLTPGVWAKLVETGGGT